MKGLLNTYLLLIVSCVNNSNKEFIRHDYTFKGQSGKWSAELRVLATEVFTERNDRLTYSCVSQETFTLSYKAKVSDLSAVKKLVYSYEGVSGGSTLVFNTPPTQTVFRSKTSSRGGAFERQDSIIQVKVEVDEVLTKFQLTNMRGKGSEFINMSSPLKVWVNQLKSAGHSMPTLECLLGQ